jgi:hypothetical protein
MEKQKLVRNAPHQKYFLTDGTQVPGGSTISKLGDSVDGLIYWAWDLGKQGKDYRKVSQEACDVGTLAHFMIEAYLNAFVCDLSDYEQDLIDKALVSYNKFVDWWEEQKLRKVYTEIQLVNEACKYGGTIDLIAERDNGEFVLIDFKTSKKISDSYWRQCAGYAQLFNCNNPQMVSSPHNEIKSHAIVRIGKQDEGDFEVVWKPDLLKEWNVFQSQVNLYWAMQAAKPEKKTRKKKA